jgi:hypothetical protein
VFRHFSFTVEAKQTQHNSKVTDEYQRNLIDSMNEFIHLTHFFVSFLDGSNVANVIENHVTPIFFTVFAKILGIAFCYFANNEREWF